MPERILIDDQGWHYKLYKLGDKYELVIPSDKPAPGCDVGHYLEGDEWVNYQKHGSAAFEVRIKDMKENPTKYRYTLWR